MADYELTFGDAGAEEFFLWYDAGLYDLGDGGDPVECPEGYYLYDEDEGVWYLLDEADGEAYELEVE